MVKIIAFLELKQKLTFFKGLIVDALKTNLCRFRFRINNHTANRIYNIYLFAMESAGSNLPDMMGVWALRVDLLTCSER